MTVPHSQGEGVDTRRTDAVQSAPKVTRAATRREPRLLQGREAGKAPHDIASPARRPLPAARPRVGRRRLAYRTAGPRRGKLRCHRPRSLLDGAGRTDVARRLLAPAARTA